MRNKKRKLKKFKRNMIINKKNIIQERPRDLTNRDQIETNLKIRDKRGTMVPFMANKAQRYYEERKTRRNLILKARQKGLSKWIDADQLVDCVNKPTNAVVISHEKEATKRLFAAVKYFIDHARIKPTLSIESKSEMRFPEMESYYFIGTAGQKAFGRGDTVSRAHLSEAAFYDNLEKILGGIAEAAEYGQIDIETTPNGREAFYDLWQKAKDGKSPYTCIFIPWFIDDEYSVDSMTEKEKQGLSVSVQEMFEIPESKFEFTKEENILKAKVKKEYGFELTVGQMKWRRYKIWDKGDLFFQEYPEDDVTCFLQSGRSVFKNITRDETKRIPLDDMAKFEKWGTEEERAALRKRIMFAGVDGAEGTADGDAHVFSVIDVRPDEGKAYVVYEYKSNEPIDVFWSHVKNVIMDKDGKPQFRIILGVEKNGVGVAHCRQALAQRIRHKEWVTSGTTRPVMITELEEAYRKEELIETYKEAEDEARNMVYTKSNRAEHQTGKHDDRVFARAVAWQMRKMPIPRVTRL